MNIFNSTNLNLNNSVDASNVLDATHHTELVQNKLLNDLQAGDKFSAKVLDIKYNEITIKLLSGETLTAKARILPDVRMGEDSIFTVKENVKGQIFLEMMKLGDDEAQGKMAKQVLTDADLPTTKENIDLIKSMIKENMPLDEKTLEKALFFRHSNSVMDIDKTLFLLKENFPANENSVNQLLSNMNNKDHFTKLITELKTQIDNLDSSAKNQLLEEMQRAAKELSLNISDNKDKLLDRLFLDLNGDDTLNDTGKYFKFIQQTMNNINQNFSNNESLTKLATDINDAANFMNQIKHYKELVQLPILVGDEGKQTEFQVYKDGNKKKDLKKQASVLLALDYDALGHLDIFVNKNEQVLTIQFETETDESITALKTNMSKLETMLRGKGFRLTGTTYLKSQEKSKLTDMEFHHKKTEKVQEDTKVTRRYSFDMHV